MSEWVDTDGDPLPDAMELRPDRLRWLVVFLICVSFVAIALWMGSENDPLLFWGGGGFFLLGALIAVPSMLGVGSNLKLDRDGFACRTLFRTFRREWRQCSVFYPVRIGMRQFVGFSTLQDEAAHPNLSAFNREAVGASGMLPDTFGHSADTLADLLNRFRERANAT